MYYAKIASNNNALHEHLKTNNCYSMVLANFINSEGCMWEKEQRTSQKS